MLEPLAQDLEAEVGVRVGRRLVALGLLALGARGLARAALGVLGAPPRLGELLHEGADLGREPLAALAQVVALLAHEHELGVVDRALRGGRPLRPVLAQLAHRLAPVDAVAVLDERVGARVRIRADAGPPDPRGPAEDVHPARQELLEAARERPVGHVVHDHAGTDDGEHLVGIDRGLALAAARRERDDGDLAGGVEDQPRKGLHRRRIGHLDEPFGAFVRVMGHRRARILKTPPSPPVGRDPRPGPASPRGSRWPRRSAAGRPRGSPRR